MENESKSSKNYVKVFGCGFLIVIMCAVFLAIPIFISYFLGKGFNMMEDIVNTVWSADTILDSTQIENKPDSLIQEEKVKRHQQFYDSHNKTNPTKEQSDSINNVVDSLYLPNY